MFHYSQLFRSPGYVLTYGHRESRHWGLQGDVRLLHDIIGDGRGVAVSDESWAENTETVWWVSADIFLFAVTA